MERALILAILASASVPPGTPVRRLRPARRGERRRLTFAFRSEARLSMPATSGGDGRSSCCTGAPTSTTATSCRTWTGYKAGDPDAVAAYYRIHFKAALRRPEDYERLMARMRPSFTTSEAVLKARRVEDRLMAESWSLDGYDLLPRLRSLAIPTLVVYGDHDFIPSFVAEHIAAAVPAARLVTMRECGHFAYLECPGPVRKEIDGFFRKADAPARPR